MLIKPSMLEDYARGAAFLGSGGGGDPYYSFLLAQAASEKCGDFELMPVDELPDEALVAPCGWIGAPTVSVEKLPNGKETVAGLKRLETVMGRKIDAVMPIEIGGGNGLAPLVAAAELGIPIIDADGMGRAFPESQMTILNIKGLYACPSVLTAACGATTVIETDDNHTHERIARSLSVALGGIAHMVEYPLTGAQVKTHAITGSVSAAIAIGRAVSHARKDGQDPFLALGEALEKTSQYPHCKTIFDGKICDLQRETSGGFSVGTATIKALERNSIMRVQFQNENLIALEDGKLKAVVPDIITIMDRESADTITTERLKYGQRVKVVAAAAPTMLRAQDALKFVGPRAFGLNFDFHALEELSSSEPL